MKIRVIEKNVHHVKVAIFVGEACNGTLVFTEDEWYSFRSALRATRGSAGVVWQDFTEEKNEQ